MNKNKKNKVAIALEDDHGSPLISSKGEGKIADLIIRAAKRHNIPVVKEPKIVEILKELPIDEPIPDELLPALEIIFKHVK